MIRSVLPSRSSLPGFGVLVLVIGFTALLTVPTADARSVGKNLEEVDATGPRLSDPVRRQGGGRLCLPPPRR